MIPQSAVILGTVRTLHADTQNTIEQRMREICVGVDASHRVKTSLDYQRKCPINMNHRTQLEYAITAARQIVDEAQINENCPPWLGGEDFSFMLEKVPGVIINLGNGDTPGLHNPKYDFADDAIPYGISYWVKFVETRLPLGIGQS